MYHFKIKEVEGLLEFSYTGGIVGLGNAFGRINPYTRIAHLDLIRVDPQYRMLNVGRNTMDEIEELVKQQGANEITGEAKTGSEEFWKSLGYEIITRKPGDMPKIRKCLTI